MLFQLEVLLSLIIFHIEFNSSLLILTESFIFDTPDEIYETTIYLKSEVVKLFFKLFNAEITLFKYNMYESVVGYFRLSFLFS